MNLIELKNVLGNLTSINFRLDTGVNVPDHFHVTEVGLISKHFIDCGGVERKEKVVNFQLWEAHDYEHRLAPQKLLRILDISKSILKDAEDLQIEVEYQQGTIGRFGLDFDGKCFILTTKRTACLAEDACGIPPQKLPIPGNSCCSSKGGCC